MIEKNVEAAIKEGAPWSIVGKFATFEEADRRRTELSEEESLQVKVHYQGRINHRFFAVKVRLDPAIAEEEEARIRREEKKRRKVRLQKKRRKK